MDRPKTDRKPLYFTSPSGEPLAVGGVDQSGAPKLDEPDDDPTLNERQP
jgi:hypothetical protein